MISAGGIRTLFALALVAACAFALSPAEAREKTAKEKLEYRPLSPRFWNKAKELIAAGKAADVFSLSVPGETTAEQDEWRLMAARALMSLSDPIHAQYLLSGVAAKSMGTRQGLEALRILNEVARSSTVDETYLEELAFGLDTHVEDPDARSLIGYFRARSLLHRGYPEWAHSALSEIQPQSTWSEELQYDRAQQLLNSGDSATAYARFESFTKSPLAREQTAKMSKLALARLIFERKDFKAAIATYLTIDLPTRERTRSLNELAWSYFYDRAYGKALGVIRAIKSQYFRPLLSPETLLLEMLIYRELCHYQKVKDLAAEFQAEYKQVFDNIENRKPLDTIPMFIQMALQEGVMQKRALAIQQVHMERRAIERQSWSEVGMLSELVKLGEKRERIIEAELNRMLKARVETVANWFIDLREQARFLEYEVSMRMIQRDVTLDENYVPPKANRMRPDVMFWPVTKESWLDELLDYEVLIYDNCQAAAPTGGGGR